MQVEVKPFYQQWLEALVLRERPALPSVSIVVISFNNRRYVDGCLGSLGELNYAGCEIVVVDNASTDGTAEYIETHYPNVHLVRAGANLGFGGGNNLGAAHATGEYLAFINMDTVADAEWLTPLVTMIEENPDVGLATSKILLLKEPDRINTCGNDVHLAGFGYLRGWLYPASALERPADVASVSGAAFVIRRDLFSELGGFDDWFNPAYVEDTDLSWRARLLGYRCRYVPESVVYHDYAPRFSPEKYSMIERNRYQMLIKNLSVRTLLLLLPALLMSEVVSWGFAVLAGRHHMAAKLRTYRWLLTHLPNLLQRRRAVQRTRRADDRDLLRYASLKLAFGQTGAGLATRLGMKLIDPLFAIYYRAYWAITGFAP
jgi:GT2 family glycosyltransferase